jgi:hypothetical protein
MKTRTRLLLHKFRSEIICTKCKSSSEFYFLYTRDPYHLALAGYEEDILHYLEILNSIPF